MCTHLSKRGSTYYFRRLIPLDVRATLDEGAEWVWSLRTKDRDEGKRRAQADTVATNDKIADVRQRLTTSTVGPSKEPDTPAIAITAWELEQADHDEREREEASERKHGRRHRRRQIEERMHLPTAALSETEAAYRDVFRSEKRKRIEAEEKALIARAELASAKGASPLAAPPAAIVPRQHQWYQIDVVS